MKKYVFITNSIRNMGGAQMYIRNKMMFLQQHGWSTTVYFFTKGDILIPELQQFEGNRIPEMGYPISAVTPQKRERVLNRIASELESANECVLESNVYPTCYWAEAIAERIKGRNILYILHEGFPSYNSREEAYLKFKLDRREFMNGSKSIEIRLGKKWGNDTVFRMPSYSNVTTSVDYPLEYNKKYKTILSIGRLDKPYIIPMLKEIAEFTERTSNNVNLFLVGGAAEDSYINNIKSYLQDKPKIVPFFFGYMFPVANNIIKASNVAIASSGSVLVPSESGVPTIAIDTQDYMAMGIYGETTQNTFTRQYEPKQKTSDLLYEVLIEGKYCDMEAKPSAATLEANSILEEHLSVIESLDAPRVYYDVFGIFNKKEVLKQKFIMLVYRTLGENGIVRIMKLKRKLIK